MLTSLAGEALLVCDAVARDPSGKVTLYGVFERILATRFPAVHPMLSVYWKCRVPSAGRLGVRILRPDGSTMMELEPVASDRSTVHTVQGTYTLSPVEFPTDGSYTLVLRYNDHDILTTDIQVVKKADG